MNFYSVPAISYQQQQKLKRKYKKSSRRTSRKDSSSDNQDKSSVHSSLKSERSILDDDSNLIEDEKTKHHSPLNKKATSSNISSLNSPPFARINTNKLGDSQQIWTSKYHENDSPRVSQDDFRRPSISSMASFVSGKISRVAKSQLSQSSNLYASSMHSTEIPDAKPESLPDHKEKQNIFSYMDIPDFVPILDLSILNDIEDIKKEFLNPDSLRQRYQTFLSILSEHHINDPINFASVREQSLRSFARRLKQSQNHHIGGSETKDQSNMNFHEDSLTYELLEIRFFLRKQIRDESIKQKKNPGMRIMEEVLHSNFFNYIRYLVNLPDLPPHSMKNLSEIQRKHYEYRSFFHDMSAIIYAQKKDGFEDEISTFTSRVQLLVQAILKSSYEFILLEKYVIQILVKLNNDFLIENRITKSLFNSYKSKMISGDKESVKCLVLNSFFSVNYSWYLAITIPFVRFFETSIFNEEASRLLKEEKRENSIEQFKNSDEALFHRFFGILKLTDFNAFANMSRKKLVKLQECHPTNGGDSGTRKPSLNSWKPANFEYYTKSLSTIASDTFHVIHIRDFQVQFTSNNYRTILVELERILKHGGYLEIPLIVSGDESLKITWDVFGDSFLSGVSAAEADNEQATSATLKDLFFELCRIFGDKSVKFTTVLLTDKNEMNRFLLNKVLFRAFEMDGNFAEYDDFLSEAMDIEKENLKYYIYIQVKNCN